MQMLVPTRLTVPTFGAAGHPASLFGVGLFCYWGLTLVVPYLTTRGANPMRRILLLFGAVFLVAYALGHARGLQGVEVAAADRRLISTMSLLGVALFIADCVPSRARLDVLLKRLTSMAMIVAVIGFLQFSTDFDPAQAINLPGLHPVKQFQGFQQRGTDAFVRVTGTSSHPIEFGVVMAMLLPIATHYALHASAATRRYRWFVAGAIGVAVPLSISRSGTVAFAAAVIVLGIAWSPQLKVRALAVGIGAMGVLSVVTPGLLGTIRGLFTNWNSDPSIEGRTQDYSIVFDYIERRPWFGRGPGTFLPARYIVLDNEMLYTLVTIGYVGLIAMALVFFTAIAAARRVSRSGGDDTTRHLAQALMAPVVAALVVSFTFDSLSFSMFAGVLFFVFGVIGALWRLDRAGDLGRNPRRRTPLLKGWRSREFPEPHPLQRMFPNISAEQGWSPSTSS
jgi:O-antigen ligase